VFIDLTPEQYALRDQIREYFGSIVTPEYEAELAVTEGGGPHYMQALRRMGADGWLGIGWPKEYGGQGRSPIEQFIFFDEAWRAGVLLPTLTIMSVSPMIMQHGSEEQKQFFLPKALHGEVHFAIGYTEPGAGTDLASLRTRAVRDGDHWVLNGTKTFITQGSVGQVFVVLGLTNPDQRQKGITAFILERGLPGFTQRPIHGKLGMRSSDTAELVMENVEVPDSQRLGELNKGFINTLQILDRGRITIGALATGLARGALEESVRYAKERRAFGQPIAEFEAIRWMLADMHTELEAARLLVHRAAVLADAGRPYIREASIAKLFASEAANRACNKAVQIHGGYGYTREFPVERYLRDAKLCEIGEGTSEVQRTVISRDLLKG
jgi:alkylation response protein AidB-like acyl-CoA dehydrogenase